MKNLNKLIRYILILFCFFSSKVINAQDYYLAPTDGSILQIAGNEKAMMILTEKNGFYVSYNKGEFWSKANNGLKINAEDLIYNLGRGNIVLLHDTFFICSISNNCVVYYTSSKDINWKSTTLSEGDYIIKIFSTNKGLIVNSVKGIYLFNQQRSSWDTLKIKAEAGKLAVVDNVLLYYYESIDRSEDFGKNWVKITQGQECPFFIFQFKNYWYFYDCLGKYFMSTNIGKTWVTMKKSFFPEDMEISSTNQMIVYNRNDTTFFKFEINDAWSVFPFSCSYPSCITDGSTTYMTTMANGIMGTNDKGKTWKPYNKGLRISKVNN